MININITIDNETSPAKLKKNLSVLFEEIKKGNGVDNIEVGQLTKVEQPVKEDIKDVLDTYKNLNDFLNSEDMKKILEPGNIKFNSEV